MTLRSSLAAIGESQQGWHYVYHSDSQLRTSLTANGERQQLTARITGVAMGVENLAHRERRAPAEQHKALAAADKELRISLAVIGERQRPTVAAISTSPTR